MRWLICLLTSFSAVAQPGAIVKEWVQDPELRGAQIAVCVTEAQTGQTLYAHNASLSVIPASTLKIFTTGAALGLFDQDHRFNTTIACTGTFVAATGIVQGDLLIIGSGDPSLQSEHFSADVISEWTRKLLELGIKEVRGNIVGVAAAWKSVIPDHWIWADISNYFGAVPTGLSFRDNKFAVEFTSGKAGSVAMITGIEPQYESRRIVMDASVTCQGTVDRAYVYGDPASFERIVQGTIPAGRGKFKIEAALPDPALLCAEELAASLKKAGVTLHGICESRELPGDTPPATLFVHRSPALAELIRKTNMHSDNLYCESLLLLCGRGNRDSSIAEVRRFWQKQGLDSELLFMADGSGLSRASTCTAALQCQALGAIYKNTALFEAFDSSLPRAGRQGSMRLIGNGTFIENNLRAKTGYMERVRAYCGYVKTRKGKTLCFSVIFNNYTCTPALARRKMEALMVSLADL